jgi:hypothetical protein
VCAAGSYSPVQGASVCQQCAAGTFDATTTARTVPCPACPANSFCLDGKTKTACPANTASVAGAGNPLGCTCIPGFLCAYTKRINAVVKLNSTLTNFQNDVGGVKTQFIASVAAAAGVPISKITIISAVAHTGARRRALLSSSSSSSAVGSSSSSSSATPTTIIMMRKALGSAVSGRRALLQEEEAGVLRVHFEALDVHPARDFRRHLREQAHLIIG